MKLNLLNFAMLQCFNNHLHLPSQITFNQTQFSLDSRFYELVDQDNQLKNADAWTLRLCPSSKLALGMA